LIAELMAAQHRISARGCLTLRATSKHIRFESVPVCRDMLRIRMAEEAFRFWKLQTPPPVRIVFLGPRHARRHRTDDTPILSG
jgi:hypothetical protein